MAVQTNMTNDYTKPADAIYKSRNSKNSGAVGYTTRGTAIVNSNTELGQNAFLNILVAELSNMDPTQNQDSTAYVTQMAEFASIEQLNNLNTTMKNFAYQQMVGQVGILSVKDDDGNNKFGLITQVYKSGATTYATIQDTSTGKYSDYEISKIIGTSDSGYTSSIYETALNSNYQSAAELAKSNAEAIILDNTTTKVECMDTSGNTLIKSTTTYSPLKCKITGAYLDKTNSKVVVTVTYTDSQGGEVSKDYDYSSIAIAGKLSEDKINEVYKKYENAEPTITYTNKLTGAVVSNPILKAEQAGSSSSGTSGTEGSDSAETNGSATGSSSSAAEGTSGTESSGSAETSRSGTGNLSSETEGTNSTVTNEGIRSINNSYSNEKIYNASIASENDILSRILES